MLRIRFTEQKWRVACEFSPYPIARQLLQSPLVAPKDPLRLSPLLRTSSGQILEAVRKLDLEGVVGKRLDSRYEPGERSGAWIKLRVNLEQEFVIDG
jgi:ATP-dependent DNA ligase